MIHYRMFSSISGLHPLDASIGSSSLAVKTKNCLQKSPIASCEIGGGGLGNGEGVCAPELPSFENQSSNRCPVTFKGFCSAWWYYSWPFVSSSDFPPPPPPGILLDGSFLHLSFHSAECLWRTLCRSPTFNSPLWYSTLQKLVPWPLRVPCSLFSLRETARLC